VAADRPVIRAASDADRDAITRALTGSWGEVTVIAHGTAYDASRLPALVAERDGELVGLRRLWLITTNDNLAALRFYQRRGMRITGVSPSAVDAARELKPSIPLTGAYGIGLHDELTLELTL
jgi:hypothetical protein